MEVDAALFRRWHADPDVHPFVLCADGELHGYGEVWTDEAEGEAELARIVVAPDVRGRGLGRRLVRLPVARAEALGFDEIWLRVIPSNEAAIACYRGAGFVRAAPGVEASFNVGQPHEYVWMRLETAD